MDPARSTKSSNGHLNSTPAEVLDNIFERLCVQDQKSLRATCRRLAEVGIRWVFSHVSISLLKHDHERFFQICQHAHLAPAVKCVTWYEIPLLINQSPECRRQILGKEVAAQDGRDPSTAVYNQYRSAVEQDCWKLLVQCTLSEYDGALPKLGPKEKEMLSRYVTNFEKLPRLRAVVSENAPMDKIIFTPEDSKPAFTVEHLIGLAGTPPGSAPSILHYIMAESSNLNITELRSIQQSLYMSFMHAILAPLEVFGRLELIDICLGDPDEFEYFEELGLRLRASHRLRDLKLCFCTAQHSRWSGTDIFEAVFRNAPEWPGLSSLELAYAQMEEQHFFTFLEENQTLHQVSFCECYLVHRNNEGPESYVFFGGTPTITIGKQRLLATRVNRFEDLKEDFGEEILLERIYA